MNMFNSLLWGAQDRRCTKYRDAQPEVQDASEIITESIAQFLPKGYYVEAVRVSKHGWLPEDGFNGWEARIYTDLGQRFYDMPLDMITSETLEHYVNHAILTLKHNWRLE